MAFLDNSGDIILDAVLTDTGRYRLAKGDGSFKIRKFALGDDEIDYSLYDKNHPSGSAYYDLQIMQTPVLEALTDNSIALKSHLLTISQTDLLFLPVMRLNELAPNSKSFNSDSYFIVISDRATAEQFSDTQIIDGAFFSHNRDRQSETIISVHQGLDTDKVSANLSLSDISAELTETVYMIEMDHRLGVLLDPQNRELQRSYIDDDQVATYLVSFDKNSNVVSTVMAPTQNDPESGELSPIQGPRGTKLSVRLAASLELQTNEYLFEEFGSIVDNFPNALSSVTEFHVVDSNIRITGATTGYRIDIPIRYVKKV
jgi:hypothetical protein